MLLHSIEQRSRAEQSRAERASQRDYLRHQLRACSRPASAVATEMPSKPKTMAISMAFVRGTCPKRRELGRCSDAQLRRSEASRWAQSSPKLPTKQEHKPVAVSHSPGNRTPFSRTSRRTCRAMCDRITGVGAVSGAALLFTAWPIVGFDAITFPNRLKVLLKQRAHTCTLFSHVGPFPGPVLQAL